MLPRAVLRSRHRPGSWKTSPPAEPPEHRSWLGAGSQLLAMRCLLGRAHEAIASTALGLDVARPTGTFDLAAKPTDEHAKVMLGGAVVATPDPVEQRLVRHESIHVAHQVV